jgi:hypothetical protein
MEPDISTLRKTGHFYFALTAPGVDEHLDGTWSVGYGPHCVGRYSREGIPQQLEKQTQRRLASRGKAGRTAPLEIAPRFPLSHGTTTKPIPTTPTKAGHFMCDENRTF